MPVANTDCGRRCGSHVCSFVTSGDIAFVWCTVSKHHLHTIQADGDDEDLSFEFPGEAEAVELSFVGRPLRTNAFGFPKGDFEVAGREPQSGAWMVVFTGCHEITLISLYSGFKRTINVDMRFDITSEIWGRCISADGGRLYAAIDGSNDTVSSRFAGSVVTVWTLKP